MTFFAIHSHHHLGDAVIMTGAVRNVKSAHPEIRLTWNDHAYDEVWLHNDDIENGCSGAMWLPKITYGTFKEEQMASNGNLVEGFTRNLCNAVGVPMVPVVTRIPVIILSEEEKEDSLKWRGKWLLNANGQTCTISKCYPYWQKVVDGLRDIEIVQIGSSEERNISMDLDGVMDYRGKSSIRELFVMAYGCDGIISPPSSIMNIGAAFKKRMIVINGARELCKLSNYDYTMYVDTIRCGFGTTSACVSLDLKGSRKCTDLVQIDDRYYASCMEEIKPQRIVDAVKKALQEA